jgi:hypothetical protein
MQALRGLRVIFLIYGGRLKLFLLYKGRAERAKIYQV